MILNIKKLFANNLEKNLIDNINIMYIYFNKLIEKNNIKKYYSYFRVCYKRNELVFGITNLELWSMSFDDITTHDVNSLELVINNFFEDVLKVIESKENLKNNLYKVNKNGN